MKTAKSIGLIVLILMAGIGGFFLGRFTAPETPSVTFYAEVEKNGENYLLVQGLAVNDVNHRGRFDFGKSDDIELVWRNTKIAWEDLDEGDTVAVTYTGSVMETEPAKLAKVLSVQLLEDEK